MDLKFASAHPVINIINKIKYTLGKCGSLEIS